MGILKLIKNIITNNYEKNTITRSTKDLYLLFDFLYFIRKNKEFPKNKKLVENMNIVIKVLCKKETYDAINRYFYVFSSIIYNLIISISIKNAPFYLYVVGDLMILFITILIEIFLARKDQIRFSVTLLINSLLVIIVILEGEPERMVNAISNIQSEHLPILKEKTQKFSSSDQVKKTRSSISLETRYGDLYREKIILNSLEQAAKYVESYIPRRLRSKDILTDDWFKDSMRQVAAALREKKKWILTPKQDTHDILVERMISTFVCVVNGDWDALERVEFAEATRPSYIRMFFSLLLKFLRVLLIAALPLLFFALFQLTPFAITGAMRDYVAIGVLLWLGLTVLMSVDANISTKFSAMKDLRDLLSPRD